MLLSSLAPALLAVSTTIAAPSATEEAPSVEVAFQAIQSATRSKNLEVLKTLVDEQYLMIHGYGPSEPRSAWLTFVQQGTLARQNADGREWNVRIREFGDTAVRSWIVRLRREKQDQDTWMQGTATFVRRDGRWRMVQQQSTLLHEGPIVNVADFSSYVGAYSIPDRRSFEITDQGGYLALRWLTGAEMALIPLGSDRFVSAYGSTMVFQRGPAGKIVGVMRFGGGNRELFRATRLH